MGSDGGTKIYCENCQAVTTCKAVWPDLENEDKPGNYYLNHGNETFHFRTRSRECLNCDLRFETYEIDSSIFQKLLSSSNEDSIESGRSGKISEALLEAQTHLDALFDLLANDEIREQIGYEN